MALIDNIILYYKLDESSGSSSKDEVGGVNGVITGSPTHPAGKIGNGLLFSGSGQYVTITNTLGSPPNITVNLWVKPSFINSNEKYFTRDWNGGTNWGFQLSQDNVSNNYQVGVHTSSNWFNVLSTTAVATGGFVMITLTYDGNNLRIYVNGSNEASTTTGSTALSDLSSKVMYIGCLNTTTNLTTSLVDEVGYWGRALSGSEITALYNSGSGLSYPFGNIFPPKMPDYMPIQPRRPHAAYMTQDTAFNPSPITNTVTPTTTANSVSGADYRFIDEVVGY